VKVQQRTVLAYHEIGHVLLHSLTPSHTIKLVSIEHGHGKCVVGVPYFDGNSQSSPQERETALRVIEADLAGGIAVAHKGLEDHPDGADCDHAHARYVALRLCNGSETEANALLDWLQHRVESTVHEHWRAIERLAAELEKHGRLTGEEIAKVIGSDGK
jgi:hypothetical protein